MFNTSPMKFDHFEADGLAVYSTATHEAVEILVEMPHQTVTGRFRAVVWDTEEFTCLDIFEANTFTQAALMAAEMHSEAKLTDAAKEQILVEQNS